ncbi:phenylalanine ammonia-lyase [Marinimicrobium koreense]|uniref:Phenylalanine ammonia-lyase n=1 Tax=Marinimicrobium koreense TaxID=306545 RepID=A0A3N1P0D6_9GAMM|nr:aromatic amino acid ammonia-lyase [Marinimicrobium koreense]ROQ21051.1 phenylalanine ammonia-lyase [Marinimicrobium koreense]
MDMKIKECVVVGEPLTLEAIRAVAVEHRKVRLTDDPEVLKRISESHRFIQEAAERGESIYGVTSSVGAMADLSIPKDQLAAFQNKIFLDKKVGTGKRLSNADVRAGMLLRATSLTHGVSGVRKKLIERIILFLNEDVCPTMFSLGSIGASGDLVPLSYLAGLLRGLPNYKASFKGELISCKEALERLDVEPIDFMPKETLAIVNGTSVHTGVAANCLSRAKTLLTLTLGNNALFYQGLEASRESMNAFVHLYKPHQGQVFSARHMASLLEGSQLCRTERDGEHVHEEGKLIQDRYSLRCYPQYFGPIVEEMDTGERQILVEANSVTDNPLIDADSGTTYHCGNFLGQYPSVAMDRLRYNLGVVAKYMDVQISLLVTPAFSNGLPPGLKGNMAITNMGLNGLQICGNSIMPMIGFYGQSLADKFPSHAEMFNQNINSLSMGSAALAKESLYLMERYVAICLIFGLQAVDLRSHQKFSTYDPRQYLSESTRSFYEAAMNLLKVPFSSDKPFIWNDEDQGLDEYIDVIVDDIHGANCLSQTLPSFSMKDAKLFERNIV